MWNRTLVYLGLREESESHYDELPERFVPEDDPYAEHAPQRPAEREPIAASVRGDGRGDGRGAGDDGSHRGRGEVRSAPRSERTERLDRDRPARESSDRDRSSHDVGGRRTERSDRDAPVDTNVRPLRTGDVHVRAVPSSPLARAALVEIEVFEDVEAVAARYRTGQPVLFDVTDTDRATARRVVDFVSGVTYALRGQLTKVGTGAFLLVPDGVELPAEERRRLGELGYRLPVTSARSAE